MKAFVTGGVGFIGSHVVDMLLALGAKVTVYDNFSTGKKSNLPDDKSVSIIKGDIRKESALIRSMKGHDMVFHLAADVGNVKSIENPRLNAEINVDGTINVMTAAKKAKVKKVIFSSSCAIFGETQKMPIDERHSCYPVSPYGVSKLAAERYALNLGMLYGIDVVALRYFNVYGPRQIYSPYSNVIPIFINNSLRGKPLTIFGDGKQTRDFIHVKDVAKANILAADSKAVGTFNIATGKKHDVNQLAHLILKATQKRVPVQHVKPRPGEVMDSQASIKKAKKLLKYTPSFSLENGIRDYYKWLLQISQ